MESDGVHARKRGGGDQGADAVTWWIALHRLKLQSKSGDLVESHDGDNDGGHWAGQG